MSPTGPSLRPQLAALLMRTQSDARLLRLFRDGNGAAFEEIFRRYHHGLLGYAATISPPDRAEDVIQDSFSKAYRALKESEVLDLRAWLYRVVRNTALNDLRAHRHQHERLHENYDGVEQPPEALERREQLQALIAGLIDLPPGQRQAIVKCELEGLGYREIALDLGLSKGAVRQLIHRARRNLRDAAGMLMPLPLLRLIAASGSEQIASGGVVGAGAGAGLLFKGGAAVMVLAVAAFVGTSLHGRRGHPASTHTPQQRVDVSRAEPASHRALTERASAASNGSGGSRLGAAGGTHTPARPVANKAGAGGGKGPGGAAGLLQGGPTGSGTSSSGSLGAGGSEGGSGGSSGGSTTSSGSGDLVQSSGMDSPDASSSSSTTTTTSDGGSSGVSGSG